MTYDPLGIWVGILVFTTIFVLGCMFFGTFFTKRRSLKKTVKETSLALQRSEKNPLLTPNQNHWQAEAVFNPAATVIDGKTYLLYRSVGADGVSRLGYAVSDDGVHFNDRVPYPAYVSGDPRRALRRPKKYSPTLYPSGGSWGGCEDPRMVEIDGDIHVTLNMFDGWDFIRVAALSIPKEDFLAKRFDGWSTPTLLSKPGERHKNWVLFPEKVNGKFAILHSISPRIEIEYRDSVEDIGTTEPFIESWEGARSGIAVREGYWDNYVRSAGPPPLRTDAGWLLFYHAHNKEETNRYKLGAMLLDLEDPTKVLYRSAQPILEPNCRYENDGKPGVVYACGSTVKDGILHVYYGGADKVICVATAPLTAFLTALTKNEHAILEEQPSSSR